jgi:NTP pyrophosphatase (non-canonical NTP hydrolase)
MNKEFQCRENMLRMNISLIELFLTHTNNTTERQMSNLRDELIQKQKEYIAFLDIHLSQWEGFRYTHGFRNKQEDIDLGLKFRQEISELERLVTESPSSIEGEEKRVKLDIALFSKLSADRAETGFKTYRNVPILYWTTAICGEAGELCNMIKKIERVRYGGIDGGSSYTAADLEKSDIAEEIGGVFIYLNLLSSLLEIDMEAAIIKTFNDKSKKYGFSQFYPESTSPTLPIKEEEKKEDWQHILEMCIYTTLIGYDDSNGHSIPCKVREEMKASIINKFKKRLEENKISFPLPCAPTSTAREEGEKEDNLSHPKFMQEILEYHYRLISELDEALNGDKKIPHPSLKDLVYQVRQLIADMGDERFTNIKFVNNLIFEKEGMTSELGSLQTDLSAARKRIADLEEDLATEDKWLRHKIADLESQLAALKQPPDNAEILAAYNKLPPDKFLQSTFEGFRQGYLANKNTVPSPWREMISRYAAPGQSIEGLLEYVARYGQSIRSADQTRLCELENLLTEERQNEGKIRQELYLAAEKIRQLEETGGERHLQGMLILQKENRELMAKIKEQDDWISSHL